MGALPLSYGGIYRKIKWASYPLDDAPLYAELLKHRECLYRWTYTRGHLRLDSNQRFPRLKFVLSGNVLVTLRPIPITSSLPS